MATGTSALCGWGPVLLDKVVELRVDVHEPFRSS